MPLDTNTVNAYHTVLDEIAHAHEPFLIAAPDSSPAKLVTVSKTHPTERIRPLIEVGQRIFGENRVQEAEDKWPALKEQHSDIELHLIGPLQTNKVKQAVALFDVIETVDREKLARALAKEMTAQKRHLPCFIQVNTGEEAQKAGILPSAVSDFISLCRDELKLNIIGLMCIPPVDEEPSLHFALLKKLSEEHQLPELSMGMSNDYQLAAAMGATYVRVGSAIFGARG